MNKVICDICGTMYPETESKCPLCGGARRPEDQVVSVEEPAVEEAVAPKSYKSGKKKVRGGGSNKGLVITILILLAAILAVGAYIAQRFFSVFPLGTKPETTKPTQSTSPVEDTTVPQATIPCTSMTLGNNVIELNAVGTAWLLDVRVEPKKTTDTISFASSDSSVAEVTDQGRVTAVAPGQAIITVTCGSVTQECRVVCDFEGPVTEETTPVTTDSTEPSETFELSRSDITFAAKGESYRFTAKGLSSVQITWTSDDSSIASIENGTVTAVAPGTTKIHGVYDGKTASCIVRCNFKDADDDQENEPTEPETDRGVHLTHEDVTIAKDETFILRLLNGDSSRIDVTFSSSDSSVCSVSGNTVTGGASGLATVSATYEGKTYRCIVRVR